MPFQWIENPVDEERAIIRFIPTWSLSGNFSFLGGPLLLPSQTSWSSPSEVRMLGKDDSPTTREIISVIILRKNYPHDIESPPSRLARVGGSFNPREWGGQEVKVLLRHPLELLHKTDVEIHNGPRYKRPKKVLEMKKKRKRGHLSGGTVFNGDLDQCFVGLIVLVGLVALATDARLALLHQWFRATALSNHLHLKGLRLSVVE